MIILLRHGETEFNREKRWQGHLDSSLTERGLDQAHQAAERLSARDIDIVISSSLGRARRTADIVGAAVNRPVATDERLWEVGFGDCDGMTEAEIEVKWPGLAAWREADRWNRATPNGESYGQVRARLQAFRDEYDLGALMADPARCWLLVGHGRSHAILAGLLLDWPDNWIIETHLENAQPYLLRQNDLEAL